MRVELRVLPEAEGRERRGDREADTQGQDEDSYEWKKAAAPALSFLSASAPHRARKPSTRISAINHSWKMTYM